MPIDTSAVAREARRVLAANRQRGVSEWDGRHYDFVCPSGATYPFQWFWDSAFHAIALLHVDPELAKQEVRCLMQGAQPDGFIPHMLLWEKSAHDAALREYSITLAHTYYTATIQPPVIARAVARIFEATGDVAFVREVLPPILRFFRWLKAYRDPDDDGLVAIIQPDESGLDASPKYDRRMRVSGDSPTSKRASSRRARAASCTRCRRSAGTIVPGRSGISTDGTRSVRACSHSRRSFPWCSPISIRASRSGSSRTTC